MSKICKKCNTLITFGDNDYCELCANILIYNLEAKLAESESELENQKEKYDQLYGCYKKTSSEDLQDKYRLVEENEQLKQQLAEEDKEIEKLQNDWNKLKDWTKSNGFTHLTSIKQMFLEKMTKIEKGE